MSGRLTILPKKTYCPWNQANVERVLRDERLERERVETEEKAGRERKRGGRAEATGEAEGHINLFPEAKVAELKLAQGQGQRPADHSGILPVPLGGTSAATPFYMRPQTNASDGGKYGKESGLRALGRGGAAAAQADEITGKIMRDQYEQREDGRKDRMDPMSRFAGSTASKSRVSTKQRMGESSRADCSDGRRRSRDDMEHDTFKEEKRRKKPRKRSRRSHDSDGSSSDSDDCTSSSRSALSENDSSTRPKSRSRDSSPSHDERRHRRKKSRRRRESKRHRRHRHRSPPADRNSRIESNGKSQIKAEELNELRRRRQAREARETERERRLLVPASGASSHLGQGSMHQDRGGHFHDQFNPALSRN